MHAKTQVFEAPVCRQPNIAPVIVNNSETLFAIPLADNRRLFVATALGDLYAFNAAGQKLWDLSTSPTWSPDLGSLFTPSVRPYTAVDGTVHDRRQDSQT
jgi:hypothetical protein